MIFPSQGLATFLSEIRLRALSERPVSVSYADNRADLKALGVKTRRDVNERSEPT